MGVDIKFNDGIKIYARYNAKDAVDRRRRFAIAEIIYPETFSGGRNHKGYLLYIRPTFYGDESTDIKYYANANKTFPHQSTLHFSMAFEISPNVKFSSAAASLRTINSQRRKTIS